MNQLIFYLILLSAVICVFGTHVRVTRTSTNEKKENDNSTDYMSQCNQTYPIKMEYLQELNSTGSFSDESEKIPMCFIECYLSKLGIFGADAQINKERTANMYELEDDEMVDDCNNEMLAVSINDKCAKAYFFVRCIMTRTMIDGKAREEDDARK